MTRDFGSNIRITVYHEGGPIGLHMEDLKKPEQLLSILYTWLQSFQSDPNANAIPYNATLAPISIADGGVPLNYAQIQHSQDILVMCAHARSSILDHINFLEYIVENSERFVVTAPTTPATVTAQLQAYQADLDLIASTASTAINDPANAKSPTAQAVALGTTYPAGTMPDSIPVLKAPTADLNGRWVSPGERNRYIAVTGNEITVDLSVDNRPRAFGIVLDGSTISVTFPDDPTGAYTGKIRGSSILWSNDTVWTRATA